MWARRPWWERWRRPWRPRSARREPSGDGDLARRVAALERWAAERELQVLTRRLVVVDPAGNERIVGDVVDGTAELSVGLPDRPPQRTGAVLFASPGTEGTEAGNGLQLWGSGDARVEVGLWSDGRRWQSGLHLDGD